MKKLLIAIIMCSMAASGYAALLTQGTSEIAVSGLWDFKTINNRYMDGQISYGYFVMDMLEVGGRASFADDDMHRTWKVAAAAEYNFDYFSYLEIVPEIIPFVGLSLGVAGTSYDINTETPRAVYDPSSKQAYIVYDKDNESDSNNGLNVGMEAGVKFFITDNLAISTSLTFDMCTGAIYPDDNDLKKTDSRLNLGMRYYF